MNYKGTKYFTILKNKKIKYFFLNNKSQTTIVFFHGFMSDMIGAKPMAVQKFCRKQKLNFLRFEYSGHGKSKGKFIKGNISKWTFDAKKIIKSKIKNNNKLIFPVFKYQILGFVGIASAPEFLEELMWKIFDKKIKKKIMNGEVHNLAYGDYVYPITKQLIVDGRKNKVLNKKINLNIPITLLHGLKDESVPLKISIQIMKICKKSKKKLIKIKSGNHSLSRKGDLKKLSYELNYMIKNINL